MDFVEQAQELAVAPGAEGVAEDPLVATAGTWRCPGSPAAPVASRMRKDAQRDGEGDHGRQQQALRAAQLPGPASHLPAAESSQAPACQCDPPACSGGSRRRPAPASESPRRARSAGPTTSRRRPAGARRQPRTRYLSARRDDQGLEAPADGPADVVQDAVGQPGPALVEERARIDPIDSPRGGRCRCRCRSALMNRNCWLKWSEVGDAVGQLGDAALCARSGLVGSRSTSAWVQPKASTRPGQGLLAGLSQCISIALVAKLGSQAASG